MVTGWNVRAEEVFGVSTDEAVGKPVEVLSADARVALQGAEQDTKSGQSRRALEVEAVARDGGAVRMEAICAPVRDPSGRGVGVSTVLREVSQVDWLSREVKRLSGELAAVNAVSSAVAHSLELSHILREALQGALRVTQAPVGWLALLNEQAGVVQITEQVGLSAPSLAALDDARLGVGFNGVVAQSGQPLLASRQAQAAGDALCLPEHSSQLGIPLLAKGKVLGVLGLAQTAADAAFTQDQVRTLTAAGGQVAVAVENARLFATYQRQAELLSALWETSKAMSSTLDRATVFYTLARNVCRILGCPRATAYAISDDGQWLTLEAEHRAPETPATHAPQPVPVSSLPLAVSALEKKQPVLLSALPNHHLTQQETELLVSHGVQCFLGLPLIYEGRPRGYLLVTDDQRARRFPPHEVSACQSMAEQATIALENARLFERTVQQANQSASLFQVAQSLTSTLHLREILHLIVRQAAALLQVDRCSLFTYDEEQDQIVGQVGYGLGEHQVEQVVISSPIPLVAAQAATTRQPVATHQSTYTHDLTQAYVEQLGLQIDLCVPLVAKEKVIGFIFLDDSREDRVFSQEQLGLAVAFANEAAVAMENARLYEEVNRLAITDHLTGLANRGRFDQLLNAEVERALRYRRALSLLYMDLDDFKRVNDTLGHPAGDQVLRRTAGVLRESVREVDNVGRYGGEEFVVLLPEAEVGQAMAVAQRIRRAIEETFATLPGFQEVPLTTSIGVASLPDHATDAHALVTAADDALLMAKRSGKNCVVVAPRP